MELLETLKKLKGLEPDRNYSRKSKEIILAEKNPAGFKFNFWNILIEGVESGSAIALAAVILLIVLGGFSIWKILSPYKIASLDPAGLQAEARDIDIQIQMANIAYNEPAALQPNLSPTANMTSTKPSIVANGADLQKEAEAKAKEIGLPLPSSTSSIDDVLNKLSQ